MTMRDQELRRRQDALVRTNLEWLKQGLDLLAEIDDAGYAQIGAQMRHVIEFYECFLDGLTVLHIDYDNRRRDLSLEQSRRAAAARIASLMERIGRENELEGDGSIFVRMEDAPQSVAGGAQYLLSSVGRELQSLSSHTVHHYALIAMMLRPSGYAVRESFGVAPSTLRYREESRLHAVAAA